VGVWARGAPQKFWDPLLISATVESNVVKVVLVSYSQNPSCITNLKSLDSMIAEISRGPKIFGVHP